MLLVMLAAVISLPTLDPRNQIPLPTHEVARMQNNVQALLNAAEPDQDFDLAKAMDKIAMLPVDNVYLRDEKGRSSPPPIHASSWCALWWMPMTQPTPCWATRIARRSPAPS